MTSSTPRLLLSAASALLGFATAGWAQTTVATDPVGFITIALPANSDTFVNVPLKRPQEYAGLANGAPTKNTTYDSGESFIDGNANGTYDLGETFTDSANVITVQGTPGWSANQFVYAASTQPKHYYAFIAGGTKEGCFYTILSNTANSITVDLAGDDISTAVTGTTKLQITPYDTLGSVFPGGLGIEASSGTLPGQRKTRVLLPDQTSQGINLAASKTYYYYSGGSAGVAAWRLVGGDTAVSSNDDILPPDSYFIVRMAATPGSVTVMGGVQMNSLQLFLNYASNTQQDNAVALPIATSLTLRQTNLYESGAFVASTGTLPGARKDQLLVFDNSVVGLNKANSKTYYYFVDSVTPVNSGWRLVGGDGTNRDDLDTVVSPTTQLIIRKAKFATSGGTVFWKVKPPYVP